MEERTVLESNCELRHKEVDRRLDEHEKESDRRFDEVEKKRVEDKTEIEKKVDHVRAMVVFLYIAVFGTLGSAFVSVIIEKVFK